MKKVVIYLVVLVLLVFPVLGATSTFDLKTTINVSIRYLGSGNGQINVSGYGIRESLSISNQTHTYHLTIPHKVIYDCPQENITQFCTEILGEYRTLLPYLNDTKYYAERYATEKAKAQEMSTVATGHFEDKKTANEKLSACDLERQSFSASTSRLNTDVEIMAIRLEASNKEINDTQDEVVQAKSSRTSWVFFTLIAGVALGYYLGDKRLKIKKPSDNPAATEKSSISNRMGGGLR
ncbi:MAG: hypothetical protein U9O94_08380 [Nanoarchaeota archaeon]|nr:hypothetical protein [Nanoarchaeota archaeon]